MRARDQLGSIEPPSYNSLQAKMTQFNAGDPPPNYNSVCKDYRSEVRNSAGSNQNNLTNSPKPTESTRPELATVHGHANVVQIPDEINTQGNRHNV